MSTGKYESQIIEAIQLVVDNAISKAGYDKTIQGNISRCVDATIGKYIVKYQNSSFYAYSSQTDTEYIAGTSVYVLIPSNDMTLDKTIIGTVEHLGPDYVTIIEGENGYEVTGKNILSTNSEFELCSYKENETLIIYDRDNSLNLVGLDEFAAAAYIQQSSSIIFGAKFRTSLPVEQQFAGDYGIVFELDFKDNISGLSKTKSYILNIDQMNGNPYNYKTNTRQYSIYEVDGENFISVKRIFLFQYDFPKLLENKANDIFFSNIEFSGANILDQNSVSTQTMTFITPQGIYFDETDLITETREIQANIRIKGQSIDNESQSVKYYWFIENGEINNKSEKFNKYAGAGWECLNDFNLISIDEDITSVEWIPSTYSYKTTKGQNIAKETTYKCVAVYNNDTVLQKSIVIYNYDSNYEISIQSNDGVTFFYDLGQPDLTCYVNGVEEISNDFKYVWNVVDNNNRFTTLSETIVSNDEYNDAVAAINLLENAIENETSLAGEVAEELRVYKNIVEQYEYIMRIEKNKIYNLKVSEIENFSTYKCQVYNQNMLIGTGHIIITNTLKNEATYTVAINNGVEIFKYDEAGIAPDNRSLEDPMTIMPLSFELYDDLGRPIDKDAINGKNVKWRIPKNNTMLKASAIHGNPIQDDDPNWDTYVEYFDFYYEINPTFNPRFINNNIQLIIEYKDKIITNYTNFTFTKEGESGTNGTQYVCKIVPNAVEDVFPQYPTLIYNKTNGTHRLNYTPQDANKWFNAELYEDGELIFSNNVGSGDFELEWSILKNHYGTGLDDESNFTVEKLEGAFTFENTTLNNPANIVKCKIKYKDVEYFANLPITVATVESDLYDINLIEGSGFRKAMYTTDGKNPSYNTNYPFELDIFQTISGIKENNSLLNSSEFAVDYNWSVLGQTHITEWKSEINLIEKSDYAGTLKRNQKDYKPIDTINGLCVNNAIRCSISREGSELINITIPVHLYINRFGNSAMNDWDGNSISINEDEGIILSPQVGAGYKDDNNAFTGVFMGSVKEAGDSDIETGLFGYNAGQRTVSINAEDGSARFGKTGGGQIVIDPSTNEAVIRSGDYLPKEDDPNGIGSGMEINLTDPSISFGTGKFKVLPDGQLVATGFSTTDDLEDLENKFDDTIKDIEVSIKYLDVSLDSEVVYIPANNQHYPNLSQTFTINFIGIYKGEQVTPTATFISNSVENVVTKINSGNIQFTVDSTKRISEVINLYKVKFTYKDIDDTIYEIDKNISLNLSLQGEDGAQGLPGQGVDSITTEFYLSNSKESLIGGSWTEEAPEWEPGKYMWTRSKITYTNPSSTVYTVPICDTSWEAINGITIGARNYIRETKGFIRDNSRESGWLAQPSADWVFSGDDQDFVEASIKKDGLTSDIYAALYSNIINTGPLVDANLILSFDFKVIDQSNWTVPMPVVVEFYDENKVRIGYLNPLVTNTKYYGDVVLEDGVWKRLSLRWKNTPESEPTIPEDAKYLGLKCSLSRNGEVYYRKIKLEQGTVPSDWSAAPEDIEDLAIASTVILYGTSDDKNVMPGDNDWYVQGNNQIQDGAYIWQKTRTTYVNGDIIDSLPTRLTTISSTIISVYPEYLKKDKAVTEENILHDDPSWTSIKPGWTEGFYIWTRTRMLWSTGHVEYSIPYCDTDPDTLQSSINQKTFDIVNGLEGLGFVRIFQDRIFLLDQSSIEDSKNVIALSNLGIAFTNTGLTQDEDTGEWDGDFTSVWSVDGTFDAQSLEVINLKADNITNGILTLGKGLDSDGNEVNGMLTIHDLEDKKIIQASGDGLIIYLDDGGEVRILPETGLTVMNKAGQKIYGNNNENNAFEAQTIKVLNEVHYGEHMKTILMENTINGKKHKGIGFIRY